VISGIEHGCPLRTVMSVSESVPKKKRKLTKLQAEASPRLALVKNRAARTVFLMGSPRLLAVSAPDYTAVTPPALSSPYL
jgi:hypothetical protein